MSNTLVRVVRAGIRSDHRGKAKSVDAGVGSALGRLMTVGVKVATARQLHVSFVRGIAAYQVVSRTFQTLFDVTQRNGEAQNALADMRQREAMKATVRIIANPASGSLRHDTHLRTLRKMQRELDIAGIAAELKITQYRGHATELAHEAVKLGMDMVVAAGGDGTINDIIQALAGRTTALGVIPLGTVNVWAREVGIPLQPDEACQVLIGGMRRRVDLGRAGSRYFLLMAGVGFDAEVARRVEGSILKCIGFKFLDYLATAGMLGITHQPALVTMKYQKWHRSINALMVLVGNTRLYGGALTFTKQAIADDGKLDVVVVGGGGMLHRLNVLVHALLRRESFGPNVRYYRCEQLRLESRRQMHVQVDGEIVGTLPMTFSVAPLSLTVVVPVSSEQTLFSLPPVAGSRNRYHDSPVS